jgi:hypothetical protein
VEELFAVRGHELPIQGLWWPCSRFASKAFVCLIKQ